MADKKILFVAQAVYQTIPPVTYEAGEIHTMREDVANRWLSRGLATDDAEQIASAEAAKVVGDVASTAPAADPELEPAKVSRRSSSRSSGK